MKTNLPLLLYLIVCAWNVNAQKTSETLKVDSLTTLAWEEKETSPPTALSLSAQAIQIAEKIDYWHGLGNAYSTIGFVYGPNMIDSANAAWNLSIKFRRKNSDSVRIANIYNQMADCWLEKGDYPNAQLFAFRALDILKDLQAPTYGELDIMQRHRNLGSAYCNLSKIYRVQEIFPSSLKYAMLGAQELFANNNFQDSLDAQGNLADWYFEHAKEKKEPGQLDSAITFYQQYLDHSRTRKIEEKDFLGYAHVNLALMLMERNKGQDSLQAWTLLDTAEVYFNEYEDSEGLLYVNLTRGQLISRGAHSEPLKFFKRAESYLTADVSAEMKLELLNGLARAYGKTGNSVLAAKYWGLAYQLQDSLSNKNIQRKMRVIELKNSTIAETKQKIEIRNLVLYLEGLCILLLGMGFGFYRYRLIISRKLVSLFNKINDSTQDFLDRVRKEERTAMGENIHSIAGQLSSLSQVAEMVKKQAGENSALHPALDLIYRGLSENAENARNKSHLLLEGAELDEMHQSYSLKEHLDLICNLINSAGLARARHKIEVSDPPPKIKYYIGSTIDELINNTLKYAKAKNINIQITQRENALNVSYTDDGIGFPEDEHEVGRGLKDMKDRLNKLGGTIERLGNQSLGKGIEVVINIPFGTIHT